MTHPILLLALALAGLWAAWVVARTAVELVRDAWGRAAEWPLPPDVRAAVRGPYRGVLARSVVESEVRR